MSNLNDVNYSHIKISPWIFSNLFSLLCVSFIIYTLIHTIYTYKAYPNQITSKKELENFNTLFMTKYHTAAEGDPVLIPTGFFINSFQFKDPNTVIVSGYIWQKYLKKYKPDDLSSGLNFLEANSHPSLSKIYSFDYPDFKLVGWKFTGLSLYQGFDYSIYPLDRQTITIQIGPQEFYKNVIFTPDIVSYKSTKPYDVFGLIQTLNVAEFNIKDTYFEFINVPQDTQFGMGDQTFDDWPTLSFNIVIQRSLGDAFILHFLPILVVWNILFGITMVMSTETDQVKTLGSSTMSMLSALGASFFAVVIANINLRTKFMGQPPTYIEFYYFVTYTVLILLVLNVHLISPSGRYVPSLLSWRSNLLPKILYWPFITFSILLITLWKF